MDYNRKRLLNIKEFLKIKIKYYYIKYVKYLDIKTLISKK